MVAQGPHCHTVFNPTFVRSQFSTPYLLPKNVSAEIAVCAGGFSLPFSVDHISASPSPHAMKVAMQGAVIEVQGACKSKIDMPRYRCSTIRTFHEWQPVLFCGDT